MPFLPPDSRTPVAETVAEAKKLVALELRLFRLQLERKVTLATRALFWIAGAFLVLLPAPFLLGLALGDTFSRYANVSPTAGYSLAVTLCLGVASLFLVRALKLFRSLKGDDHE